MSLRDRLNEFYLQHDIPENGGEDDKTFEVPLPLVSIRLPNYNWRRKMLHVHDLEHIVNRQNTTWSGEVFIASWEIATGFWKNIPVCIFPFWTMGFGLWKHPTSVFRGFRKGCHDRGIASLKMKKDDILKLDLPDLEQLVVGKNNHYSDVIFALKLILFSSVAELVFLSPLLVIVAGWLLVR